MKGGTTLKIYCDGLNTGDSKANKVFVGGKPCDVITYHTTAGYIECLTPEPD